MSSPYYVDDSVTLWHGDALDVIAALPDESVDAIVTDPPFSSGARREAGRSLRKSMLRSEDDDEWFALDGLTTNSFLWFMREVGWQARRVLRPGGHMLVFTDWRMAPPLAAALESADLRQLPLIVWDKTYFGMGNVFRNQHELIVHVSNGMPAPPARRDIGNVIQCAPVRDGFHPTQKPVKLLRTLISVVTPPLGTVLDPFAGAGSTGVAAIEEGRAFVGAEISEGYVAKAASRLRLAALKSGPLDEQQPLFEGAA